MPRGPLEDISLYSWPKHEFHFLIHWKYLSFVNINNISSNQILVQSRNNRVFFGFLLSSCFHQYSYINFWSWNPFTETNLSYAHKTWCLASLFLIQIVSFWWISVAYDGLKKHALIITSFQQTAGWRDGWMLYDLLLL